MVGMAKGPKEEVYDREICPLIDKIKEICTREEISAIMLLSLDEQPLSPECGPLIASQMRVNPDDNPHDLFYFIATIINSGEISG